MARKRFSGDDNRPKNMLITNSLSFDTLQLTRALTNQSENTESAERSV
jgi:hypothetical protein